uniref:HMG box domain-containing protein n=1 Tax=Parascaris univalens TaxID=6257 RepID=A0A915ABJ0_PARUN
MPQTLSFTERQYSSGSVEIPNASMHLMVELRKLLPNVKLESGIATLSNNLQSDFISSWKLTITAFGEL